MQQIYDTLTRECKQKALDGYRQAVTQNPGLSSKAFCYQSGISDYRHLLWWCNDHGIRIYEIQRRNADTDYYELLPDKWIKSKQGQ